MMKAFRFTDRVRTTETNQIFKIIIHLFSVAPLAQINSELSDFFLTKSFKRLMYMKRYLKEKKQNTHSSIYLLIYFSFNILRTIVKNLQNVFSYRNIVHSKLVQRLSDEKQILPSILGMV